MTRSGVAAALLAAALLPPLVGCEAHRQPDVPGAAAAVYVRCQSDAAGDAAALTACADRTIAATWQGAPADRLAELGDAAIALAGGDSLAARAIASDAIARLALERAAIRAGARWPPAAEGPPAAPLRAAWAPLATSLCTDAPARTCDSRRERLLARLAARLGGSPGKPPATSAAPSLPLGGYITPTCAEVRGQSLEEALAGFEQNFPPALRDQRLVETEVLEATQLSALTGYLACLAAQTGYAPDVAESSLWLFESKRHGAAARADLAAQGRGHGVDAAAAREFSAQITDYQDD